MSMEKIEMQEVKFNSALLRDIKPLGGAAVRLPSILDDEFKTPGKVTSGLW